MDIKGWILRLKLDRRSDTIKIGIVDISRRYREIGVYYTPQAYISGDREAVRRILRGFQDTILDVYTEEWRLPPWYDKPKEVYVARFDGINSYYRFLGFIRSRHLPEINLYNTVPMVPQRFLLEIEAPPSALIHIYRDGADIEARCLEDTEDLDYRPPPFKRILIRLYSWYGEVYNPWRERPERYIAVSEDGGVETRSLDILYDYIRELDPDVVEYTSPLIHKWLVRHNYIRRLLYGRGRAYIDYSSTVIEPHEYYGLIELSRISYTDIGRVSRYSIGKILTTIEAIEAVNRGMAVPEYRVDIEKPKKLSKLYTVDRGGLYYIPKPGLYWNAAQCDFTSLYPNIIVKYNISNETVNRPGCSRYIDTPIGLHKICVDTRGIVPLALEKLIDRRTRLKDLARKTGDPVIDARQNAIKWILVACFGYLGYRNARFGKIEAYESVTAYARDILEKTVEIAKRRGLRVVHAIVDSIVVVGDGADRDDYIDFCREVSREIGIRMELDIHYKWLYLPRNNSRPPIAQSNRYYGVSYEGGLKVKGIEMVRRDTPPFIKEFQEKALNILAKASNEDEFTRYMEIVMNVYRGYKARIMNGDMDIRDMVITKRMLKKPYEYRGKSLFIDAAKRYGIKAGETIRFVVTSSGEAVPIEKWREGMGYSRDYYITRLKMSLRSLPIEYLKKPTPNMAIYAQHLGQEPSPT